MPSSDNDSETCPTLSVISVAVISRLAAMPGGPTFNVMESGPTCIRGTNSDGPATSSMEPVSRWIARSVLCKLCSSWSS